MKAFAFLLLLGSVTLADPPAPLPKIPALFPDGEQGYWMGNFQLKKEDAAGAGVYVEYTYTASGAFMDFFATYREGDHFYKWLAIAKDGKCVAQRKKWFVKGIDEVDRDGSGALVHVENLSVDLEAQKKDPAPMELELTKLINAIRVDYAAKNKPEDDKPKD